MKSLFYKQKIWDLNNIQQQGLNSITDKTFVFTSSHYSVIMTLVLEKRPGKYYCNRQMT